MAADLLHEFSLALLLPSKQWPQTKIQESNSSFSYGRYISPNSFVTHYVAVFFYMNPEII